MSDDDDDNMTWDQASTILIRLYDGLAGQGFRLVKASTGETVDFNGRLLQAIQHGLAAIEEEQADGDEDEEEDLDPDPDPELEDEDEDEDEDEEAD